MAVYESAGELEGVSSTSSSPDGGVSTVALSVRRCLCESRNGHARFQCCCAKKMATPSSRKRRARSRIGSSPLKTQLSVVTKMKMKMTS